MVLLHHHPLTLNIFLVGSLKSHVSESLWLITFMEMERYPYRMKRFTALPSRSWPWHPWLVSKKLMPIIIDTATDGAVVHLSFPLPMALGSRSYSPGATLPSSSSSFPFRLRDPASSGPEQVRCSELNRFLFYLFRGVCSRWRWSCCWWLPVCLRKTKIVWRSIISIVQLNIRVHILSSPRETY